MSCLECDYFKDLGWVLICMKEQEGFWGSLANDDLCSLWWAEFLEKQKEKEQ